MPNQTCSLLFVTRVAMLGLFTLTSNLLAETNSKIDAKDVMLVASFDKGADADFARGDKKIYTLESLKRDKMSAGITIDKVRLAPGKGKWGGAIQFVDNTDQVIAFKGAKNTGYKKDKFGITISFWMKVDPAAELKPGYVDPIQITDKKWDDAALWVDFTKDNPREFRFGVMSDHDHWNPKKTKFDDIPEGDRPMIPVRKPKFTNKNWSHVALTVANANTDEVGAARLYIDGKLQGELARKLKFTWNEDQVYIMLGIKYIGLIDDLAILQRELTAKEVEAVHKSTRSMAAVVAGS